MSRSSESAPWSRLEELAATDPETLREEASLMGLRECARALSRMNATHREEVLNALDPAFVAKLLEESPETQAEQWVNELAPERAAEILHEMPSDEVADLIGALDADRADAIMEQWSDEEAAEARRLAQYQPDVAGGLMVSEFLAYPSAMRVDELIQEMRDNAEQYAGYSVQYTFVTDADGRLTGVLPLRQLLLTPGNTTLERIMIPNPVSVEDTATLDALDETFEEHDYLGMPVVNDAGRIVGVLRRKDVVDALSERAESNYLKAQGIITGDELRSMPLRHRARNRLAWLSSNIVLNILAAGVIALYEDTLAAVIALAVFLPIISDMGGNAGSQAVAVSIRELSLGLLKPADALYVCMKEAVVGMFNGVVLGMLVAAAAFIWQGNVYLGLVVGLAMALNTVIAVLAGGTIPLLMKRFDLDPALASGPILTTITDICGFFLVLSLAQAMLPYLT